MRDYLAEAKMLHSQCVVLDGHADTPQRFVDEGWEWSGMPLGGGQLSAQSATSGGLHGGFLVAWADPKSWSGHFALRTRQLIASIHDQASKHPNKLAICRTPEDIRRARGRGEYAALIGVEGGHAIENDLDILREYFSSGARYMTLTWANSNDWCGSSGEGSNAPGLTAFGRDVVREMNRLGMLVDVSHVSDAAFWNVLETSSVPVIASHSSSRALCAALRNLSDDMAVALAQRGGLVMVNLYAAFLSDTWRASVPFEVLVDHFDHLLRLVGPKHVGIGSDFDGMTLSVEGMESAADLPKITAALLRRGWTPDQLKALLGENLLRVMQVAADAAARYA